MIIGIDARMYGVKHAGIGRYVENLIKNLLIIDKNNTYKLFIRREDRSYIKKQLLETTNDNFVLIDTEASHYTIKEQLLLPLVLLQNNVDLMHFPHFNVPFFYHGKYIVTIHDLLWHETKGSDVTTLSPFHYKIKYQGYRFIFSNAIQRAQKILVPSDWVKNRLITTYKDSKNKIIITYEGVDEIYRKYPKSTSNYQTSLKQYGISKAYIIYTGSAYPHKNISIILKALKNLDIQLIIACARNVFLKKLESKIQDLSLNKKVRIIGFVEDEDLVLLYQHALAFVFPSRSEGFGLPGLEAMSCGCPVLCSDIPVFHEIYQDAVLYFDPDKAEELENKIKLLIGNEKLMEDLRKKGYTQANKYSWKKTAEETLKAYKSC